jgi:hypothetical protein
MQVFFFHAANVQQKRKIILHAGGLKGVILRRNLKERNVDLNFFKQ